MCSWYLYSLEISPWSSSFTEDSPYHCVYLLMSRFLVYVVVYLFVSPDTRESLLC